MTGLADVIIGGDDSDGRTPRLRQGVVTQVSPLLVRVGSATTAAPASALAGYAPTVGDVVSVLTVTGDRLVLGSTGVTPTWTAPTLLNGWAPYAGFLAPRYRKIGDIVYLEGLVNGGATSNPTVFVLPVGFRPPGAIILDGDADGYGRRYDIQADGTVKVPSPVGYASFGGLNFSITP